MANNHSNETKGQRGRPKGSVKPYAARLRDRVRTVGTLWELFCQAGAKVNNANQFAQWFDEAMRRRHPGRTWETASNNKWRKNFSGSASLTNDSVTWLGELFPEADSLFRQGPGKVWQALWGPATTTSDLWEIYQSQDATWGLDVTYQETLTSFQIKIYSQLDFNEQMDTEDFGRAVVLVRLNDEFQIGTNEDRVDAYLCTKAILGDMGVYFSHLGVFNDIVKYLADKELAKIDDDFSYRVAVTQKWGMTSSLSPFDAIEYAYNPFFRLEEQAPHGFLRKRFASLACLTSHGFKRS